MAKILGYIISLIGIIFLALSFEPVSKAAKIPLPPQLSSGIITIIGLVIVAIGLFFIIKSPSSKKLEEVPIYHGKNVVGFRRIKK